VVAVLGLRDDNAVPRFYFAYGSNMSSARLSDRIEGVRARGAARLADHRLRFDKPSRDGSGKANLMRTPGSVCWGVVFELRVESWGLLDRFEPGYVRRSCSVTLESGDAIEAVAYFFEPNGPVIPPFGWYLEHLLAGAREHALPAPYVTRLQRTATLDSVP
jgi:gamma-glutamylcyclotransferase